MAFAIEHSGASPEMGSMQEGLEARVARLEGEVAHMARRMDSMDNWLRVIVGLQVTTMLSMAAGFVALIRLIA